MHNGTTMSIIKENLKQDKNVEYMLQKDTRHNQPEGKYSSFRFQPAGCKWQQIKVQLELHKGSEIVQDLKFKNKSWHISKVWGKYHLLHNTFT